MDAGSGKHIVVADILMDIEKELRELALWEVAIPSAEALASQQPFAVDTLTFSQWLQFIFIPRMYAIVETDGPLPGNCQIAPMAEEFFRPQVLASGALMVQLQRMDRLLGGA